MSSIRRQRATSHYLTFPATVLDPSILDRLEVQWGTQPGPPPAVIMTRAHWDTLLNAMKTERKAGRKAMARDSAAHRALTFTGRTWEDNPTIARPPGVPEPVIRSRAHRPRKPSPFAHLKDIPVSDAMRLARADHDKRLRDGMDVEESAAILLRAMAAIKRAAVSAVIPAPAGESAQH